MTKECHCEGQKLSEEAARNFSVKATKVTAKARDIECEVQQFILLSQRTGGNHG